MKTPNRSGGPLTGLAMAVILLASTAGYVSALSRVFQTSSLARLGQADFEFDGSAGVHVDGQRAPNVQQFVRHTAPAWLLHVLPGYSSSRAREAWYFSLDPSGDRRLGFETMGSGNGSVSAGYVGTLSDVFDVSLFNHVSGFAGTSSEKTSSPSVFAVTGADLYWDANGATGGTGGTGTWTTANTWRLGSPAGTLQTWEDSNNAHFEGTAGIVTISGGTTVSPLTSFFEVTGYTLRPSNTSLTTLAGSISLSPGVNLNYLSSADTADRQLAIGSVTGGGGSGLTFSGGQIASGSNARLFLNQAGSSIDVPITIGGTGTTFAGFVASAAGTGITGTITNNSGYTTLLGATSGNDLTLSSTAVISGTGGLQIGVTNTSDNVGTVILNAANLHSGGTTLDGGTLVLGNDSALGTGTFTLSNSATSIIQAGGGPRTLANNIVWGGNGTLSGSNAFTFNGTFTSSGAASRSITVNNTGGLTIDGDVFLQPDNTTIGRGLTISGTSNVLISGDIANNNFGNTVASTLTKNGVGTLTLTGTNTYTGATTVNGGTLLVNGDNSVATGAVSAVNSGSVLGGSGTIGGTVTLVTGATLQGGTGATASGALTLQNTVDTSAGIIQLALGAGGTHSSLNQTGGGAWTFSSTQPFNFIDLGATAGTTYTGIITGLANDPGTTGWTILNPGWTGTFTHNEGSIDFTLTAVPEPSTWIGGALALAAIGFTQRRRLSRLTRKAA